MFFVIYSFFDCIDDGYLSLRIDGIGIKYFIGIVFFLFFGGMRFFMLRRVDVLDILKLFWELLFVDLLVLELFCL